MALVASSIPNLINGVSQQPPALRLASQAEEVVNCLPSPVEGLKKRPPLTHVKQLFSGTAGTGRPFVHLVDRDGVIQYLVLIQDGAIKAFDLDGTAHSIATPDGTSYLDISNTSDPSEKFRVASVADYTFITNREKVVSKIYTGTYSQSTTTVTVTHNNHGLVNDDLIYADITSGSAVDGEYSITKVDDDTFTYTVTGSATNSGNISYERLSFDWGTKSMVFIKGAEYDTTYRVKLGGTEKTYTTPAVGSGTTPDTITIASQLATDLNTISGYTVTNNDYIIRITKDDGSDYTLESGDTKTGMLTKVCKGKIDDMTDLPTIAEHNFVIGVQGSKATSFDDYFVKFETTSGSGFGAGIWRETVSPGISYSFNKETMPHVLVRDASTGAFTFKQFDWSPRVAGDAATAPDPSFVGSKIENLNLFRNRLVLLADENVILSAADSYDRFWPETVQTVVDSDPIDLITGGSEINFLIASLPFANTLLLFSRHGQFRLDAGTSIGQALTPKTASVTAITSFEMSDTVDPVSVGRTVYFPIPKGEFSGLREFFLPDSTGGVPLSEEVTSSVPRYIPGNLTNLITSVSEESILAVSKDQPNRIYLYKFFFEDDTKLQSSWSYWETVKGKKVLGAAMLDSDMYVVIEYEDGVYLEKTAVRPETVDEGTSMELLLDRKISQADCHVNVINQGGAGVESVITLPYPTSHLTLTNNQSGIMRVVGAYDNDAYADENSFPASAPASGTLISIRDAGGLIVNGSGVATNAKTTGSATNNVTINGFPSGMYNKTVGAGNGLSIEATATPNTYTYKNLITVRHGQIMKPSSETTAGGTQSGFTGNATLTVLGDLTNTKFFVGELYDMNYEFSTPYLKESPTGGGMAVAGGPILMMRTWTVVFDETSSFELRITPLGRDTSTYPYNGIKIGQSPPLLGTPGVGTGTFRVPVLARNTETRVILRSDSPLPCRFQSAEWEGMLHTRARRM